MSAKGKLRILEDGFAFWCPACQEYHEIDAKWRFCGNTDRPTFQRSVPALTSTERSGEQICHSFVTNGQIRYLSDCTHDYRGQTVEMRAEELQPIEFSGFVRQRATSISQILKFPHRYTIALYAIEVSGLMEKLIHEGRTKEQARAIWNAESRHQEILRSAGLVDDETVTRFLDCIEGTIRDWVQELEAINAEHQKQLAVFAEKIR